MQQVNLRTTGRTHAGPLQLGLRKSGHTVTHTGTSPLCKKAAQGQPAVSDLFVRLYNLSIGSITLKTSWYVFGFEYGGGGGFFNTFFKHLSIICLICQTKYVQRKITHDKSLI